MHINFVDSLNITKDGWDIFFGFLGPVISLGTGLAIAWFAYVQNKINGRLKKLQDYVGISIVPFSVDSTFKLQIKNIGKQNLYLHKFEINSTGETYEKPRILACGSDTVFIVNIPNNILGIEMPVRLYVTDESDEKYISTGSVVVDPTPVQLPQPLNITGQEQQAVQQFVIRGNVRAWSYKMEKFNWNI